MVEVVGGVKFNVKETFSQHKKQKDLFQITWASRDSVQVLKKPSLGLSEYLGLDADSELWA